MRQIATLSDEAARHFSDYLLTVEIETQLIPEAAQVGLWVCDEDKVEQARKELAAFLANPRDARYLKASAVARTLRSQEERAEEEYRRRQEKFAEVMGEEGVVPVQTVTMGLLLASVILTLLSGFGRDNSTVTRALLIAPYEREGGMIRWNGLQELEKGEYWRVVTPIFLHFDILHLVFNMVMLYSLGNRVERARGAWRYLVLVLLLAAGSNVLEYYLDWSLDEGMMVRASVNPQFGGMSGVLYGLFGYLWMKSRFFPELHLEMPSQTVVVMLFWFVLCLTGVVGAVANMAHAGGLAVGVLLGVVPLLWRRRREPGA